jgi:hypothetical protein
MVSIQTEGDRTLFFDFLPFDIGNIKGYNARIQLYTIPGQVKYNATRHLVLKGVDGIVFVADSMVLREEKNVLSLINLHENLQAHKRSIRDIPLVMQYNKRDLAQQGIPLLPFERLQSKLNSKLNAPALEASASLGTNVVETLKRIITLTMVSLEREIR